MFNKSRLVSSIIWKQNFDYLYTFFIITVYLLHFQFVSLIYAEVRGREGAGSVARLGSSPPNSTTVYDIQAVLPDWVILVVTNSLIKVTTTDT